MPSLIVLVLFFIPPGIAAALASMGDVHPGIAALAGWCSWLFFSWCFADHEEG